MYTTPKYKGKEIQLQKSTNITGAGEMVQWERVLTALLEGFVPDSYIADHNYVSLQFQSIQHPHTNAYEAKNNNSYKIKINKLF